MATFFTSDTHIGHENIISKLGKGRPFADVKDQTQKLIRNHNSIVKPEDKTYFLGDIALGDINESLQIFAAMNGRKFLVPGNHDRVSSHYSKSQNEEHRAAYEDAGFIILDETVEIEIGGQRVLVSHYPYWEKPFGTKPDKFAKIRPVNEGLPLLHGHTHSDQRFTEGQPLQLNIGVDANKFFPVSYVEVELWLEDLRRRGLLQ